MTEERIEGCRNIHQAVSILNFKAVRAWAELKPECLSTFEHSISVLDIAICKGSMPMLTLLIELGVDVNLKSQAGGMSALHTAASTGNVDCARELIRQGAEVNAIGWWDNNSLHEALEERAGVAVMELLIHAGVDLELKSHQGTPWTMAIESWEATGDRGPLTLIESALLALEEKKVLETITKDALSAAAKNSHKTLSDPMRSQGPRSSSAPTCEPLMKNGESGIVTPQSQAKHQPTRKRI